MIPRLITLATCLIFLATPFALYCQENPEDSSDFDMDMEFDLSIKHPFFQIVGGSSAFSLNGVTSIKNDVSYGIDLGFSKNRIVHNSNINYQSNRGLYLTYYSPSDPVANSYTNEMWQFGIRKNESYGYPFSDGSPQGIYFDAASAPLSWYTISSRGSINTTQDSLLGRFGDGVRFGESSTASISIRATENLSINGGFEWNQTYERHMFWYWAGGTVIEEISDGVAQFFVNAVGKSSPGAMPVIHFIIRNGVAFGFKALRQNQMNWPFTTVAPLNIMTYRVGVSFTF